MRHKKARYIVDEKGKRTAVILDLATYRMLLEALDELECIRAYDEAKACEEDVLPLEEATREIERERQ